LTRRYPNHAAPTSDAASRAQRRKGTTGRTIRPNVLFVTAANDALLGIGNAGAHSKNVAARRMKTSEIAAVVRSEAMNM
jgi:DNA-binding transcriptional regulator LsrR (DeoR family)